MKLNMKLIAYYILFLLVSLTAISACTPYRDLPPGTIKQITSGIVSKEEVSVPALPAEPAPPKDYQVGPGDVLLVNINGRPEFQVSGAATSSKVQGSRVDGNGQIHIPLVGTVQVAGLTLSQIELKLTGLLKKYLQEPWVVAEVAEYKSRPLYLLGQFKSPGTFYLERPLTLMQGLALGNGFDQLGNLKGARLTREGRVMPVDLYDLLMNGDPRQNVWLKGGDSIFIPDNKNQQVFIFGAVKKPGAVALPSGGLNLAQAIASAELRDIGFDFHHLRIIRSLSATRGELIVVDYDRVLKGEALPMQLTDGDIIYVPKSRFGNWNDAVSEMLPSLQLLSNALQPFVSIKYLSK